MSVRRCPFVYVHAIVKSNADIFLFPTLRAKPAVLSFLVAFKWKHVTTCRVLLFITTFHSENNIKYNWY